MVKAEGEKRAQCFRVYTLQQETDSDLCMLSRIHGQPPSILRQDAIDRMIYLISAATPEEITHHKNQITEERVEVEEAKDHKEIGILIDPDLDDSIRATAHTLGRTPEAFIRHAIIDVIASEQDIIDEFRGNIDRKNRIYSLPQSGMYYEQHAPSLADSFYADYIVTGLMDTEGLDTPAFIELVRGLITRRNDELEQQVERMSTSGTPHPRKDSEAKYMVVQQMKEGEIVDALFIFPVDVPYVTFLGELRKHDLHLTAVSAGLVDIDDADGDDRPLLYGFSTSLTEEEELTYEASVYYKDTHLKIKLAAQGFTFN